MASSSSSSSDEQTFDILSNLPDLALGRIVSFLPFKEAGRTSILSKRWINIWRFSTNIDRFNEFILYQPMPASSSSPEETNAIRRRLFIDFVKNCVLPNVDQPEDMDTFHFLFSNPDEFQSDVDRLIRHVISKNVKDLDLEFSDKAWDKDHAETHKPSFELPETLFRHELFESLKLSACNARVHFFTSLRGLRELSLSWIELTTSDIQRLITNCDLLESVSLKKCRNLDIIEIATPETSRLSSFVIEDCSSLCEILFKIPTLRYFKYFGGMLSPFYLENFYSIEEADLDFRAETEYVEFGDILTTIFRHLERVRVLTVCSYITQVIASTEDRLVMGAARHLILRTGLTSNELLGIAFLFSSCPLLARLTFRMEPVTCLDGYDAPFQFVEQNFWKMNGVYVPCLSKGKLKEVRIEGFRGQRNEVEMLHYLLDQGRGLRRVIINCNLMPEKFKEFVRKWITQVKNASENVIVQVC